MRGQGLYRRAKFCLIQDLRCLIWDTTNVAPDRIVSPVGQYKGHEGKNIWSVAVSATLPLIVSNQTT